MDRALNTMITLAVVVVLGLILRRELIGPGSSESQEVVATAPTMTSEWPSILTAGLSLSNGSAPVLLAIFEDLECQFCRRYHDTVLPELAARYGDSIGVTFVHFPLSYHRFAMQAATALECADLAGRAPAFLAQAYSKQDSIGLIPWARLALSAGVADTTGFLSCLYSPDVPVRIEAGRSVGTAIGVRGTPTVIVNGIRFASPPEAEELASVIDSILGRPQ